eukprot:TRINITY_DN13135_c0_g1_i1.p1 TRINITY_DN13135_c0_g1~~TRINITY_DN13135_c0_g1_i1.p1  ORF type:complete len:402 (-),score=65.03 TRINITY_DN13135_c0_g1_i1:42-1247(-)
MQDIFLSPSIQPSTLKPYEEKKKAFLTGASGFLGIFLLSEILKTTDLIVYCLVRNHQDEHQIERTLISKLYQFCLWQDGWESRIKGVVGDLCKPFFGLNLENFSIFSKEIDVIFHNGADVNFIRPYSIMKAANVDATVDVIRMASLGRCPVIHYISTLSVFSQESISLGKFVTEDSKLSACTIPMYSGYSTSKYVAESICWQAYERGFPVVVHRPGAISGSSITGVLNPSDFINRFFVGLIQLGSYPTDMLWSEVEYTPVDYVSKAIVTISNQNINEINGRAFHYTSAHARGSLLVEALEDMGYSLNNVTTPFWVGELLDEEDNPLFPFVSSLEGSIPDLKYQHSDWKTREFMRKCNLSCTPPKLDAKLIQTYINYCISQKIVPPPTGDRKNQRKIEKYKI